MLDEILEKASPKHEDKNLSSSQSKYITHRATFGRVRVDRPSKPEQRQMIESVYKNYDPTSEQNQTFDARIWSLVDEDINIDKKDIDFYGLINAHHRNNTFDKTLSSSKEEIPENYIDQLAFPELTMKKSENKSIKIQKETIKELKNEEMNLIDEQYFGTLKNIEYQDEQTTTPARIEMPPKDELNYIDQLMLNPSPSVEQINPIQTPTKPQTISKTNSTSSDKLLDINFQFRINDPPPAQSSKKSGTNTLNESPMDSYNPKLESMRSIKPKDYFDPPRQSALDIQTEKDTDSDKTATQPAEQIREQLTKKISGRDSLGYRTFENLIPKWWTMTKAEIVDILIKQICFIRHGILALDKPYGLPTLDK